MTEDTVSKYTREVLTKKGYVCLKFNDSAQTGIPDCAITGNGKTIWVEDKLMKTQFTINRNDYPEQPFNIEIEARDFVDPKRAVQLVTMGKLEKVGKNAFYWLYIENNGKLYISILSPRKVFESFRDKTKMKIKVESVKIVREDFVL